MASARPTRGDSEEAQGSSSKRQRTERSEVRLAYLGPPGTYGNQAANAFAKALPELPELVPCPSIPDIYSTPAEFLVMPLQNTIHGGVTETLDCLTQASGVGVSLVDGDGTLDPPRVIGDLDLPIRHCLVVRRGTRMEDIRWVRSHEQALGQSMNFIRERLWTSEQNHARVIPWPSTAGAAVSLLDEGTGEEGPGAAICSKAVVEMYPDELEVLYEGTQGITNNFTRFLLLKRSELSSQTHADASVPPPADHKSSRPSDFYTLVSPSDIATLTQTTGPVRGVHIRPYTGPPPEPPTAMGTDGIAVGAGNIVERYPSRYLVEVAAGEVSSIGQYIGRTDLHIDMI